MTKSKYPSKPNSMSLSGFGIRMEVLSFKDKKQFEQLTKTGISEEELNEKISYDDYETFGLAGRCHLTFDDETAVPINLSYLHVPLDRYTLQGIRLLAVDFNIPANASMGWVALNNEDTYNEIQNWVRKECSDIGCYPIHYEFALWDMRGWHEKQLARGIMVTPNVDRCSR